MFHVTRQSTPLTTAIATWAASAAATAGTARVPTGSRPNSRRIVSSANHLDCFQRGETGASCFGTASGRLFDHK